MVKFKEMTQAKCLIDQEMTLFKSPNLMWVRKSNYNFSHIKGMFRMQIASLRIRGINNNHIAWARFLSPAKAQFRILGKTHFWAKIHSILFKVIINLRMRLSIEKSLMWILQPKPKIFCLMTRSKRIKLTVNHQNHRFKKRIWNL